MKRDWLWDRKLNLTKATKILKNPQHQDFINLAASLLKRKNKPQEVFREYIDPFLFCRCWPKIKGSMRKDKWSSQRITFWQAIYEKLLEQYRNKGIKFKVRKETVVNELCKKVGNEIRNIRKNQKLSQGALAKKIGVSQQLISRIEKGKENVSLITLKNIVKALNKKVSIDFI